MNKLFAAIILSAVCMSPIVHSAATVDARAKNLAASATVTGTISKNSNLNPALLDYYGYQIGVPLLAPNVGPLTSLYAAALPPRSYIGQSNPVLIRDAYADRFIGESSIGVVAL